MKTKNRILVTGSEGQLGQTLKDLYLKNNDSIDFTFVSKKELDITNKLKVQSYFNKNSFNYCINCAAYTNVEQAEKTPERAFRINAEGVNYLSQSCKASNTVLIHISTDYVFDGESDKPYSTEDKPNPINEYGKSKLYGEKYIQETLDKYFIVRTSWLYSKKYGNNFYRTIIKKAKKEEDLFVTDKQIGCPTNTENLANYIMNLIICKSDNYSIKHFCDGKIMTWYDFARQILNEHLYKQIKLYKAKNYRSSAARPKFSVLQTSSI